MRSFWCLLSLFPIISGLVAAFPGTVDSSGIQASASAQIERWQKAYEKNVWRTLNARKSGCNAKTVVKRKQWNHLTKKERLHYIAAVKCLQAKPGLTPITTASGVRTHFDDFVAVHIEESKRIHFSGLFWHFHRHFTWLYEQALRNECGYKGAQPYWDWTKDAHADPRNAPMFDGSPSSMSGNGEFIPNRKPFNATAFGITLLILPGTGGGCVQSGPFKNLTVDLGPVSFNVTGDGSGLNYNPRCLKRDFSLLWANQTRATDVVRVLTSCTDLGCWDGVMEDIGSVHSGGHFSIGGDPGLDPFVSPGDPSFYNHHSQIDRLWTLWQWFDVKNRTYQTYGTSTTFNTPPSPPVNLSTQISFGVLDKPQQIDYLSSSIDGPYCYMYV